MISRPKQRHLAKTPVDEPPEPSLAVTAEQTWLEKAGRRSLTKRLFDLCLIAIFLPLLIPVALLVGLWIKVVSPGKLFFTQERVGFRGKRFVVYKFRSMHQGAATQSHENHVSELAASDKPLTKLDALGDDRLISGGALLRSTGLDELPQLFNVLRGDMSLVGPRPCLPSEYSHYSADQRERFSALPGLTGYWQVNGKNQTTFSEMVALDVHYARNQSRFLDVGILLRTPFAILKQMCAARKVGRQTSKPVSD